MKKRIPTELLLLSDLLPMHLFTIGSRSVEAVRNAVSEVFNVDERPPSSSPYAGSNVSSEEAV